MSLRFNEGCFIEHVATVPPSVVHIALIIDLTKTKSPLLDMLSCDMLESLSMAFLMIGLIFLILAGLFAVIGAFYGLTLFIERFGLLAGIGLLLGIAMAFFVVGFCFRYSQEMSKVNSASAESAFAPLSGSTFPQRANASHENSGDARRHDGDRSDLHDSVLLTTSHRAGIQ